MRLDEWQINYELMIIRYCSQHGNLKLCLKQLELALLIAAVRYQSYVEIRQGSMSYR